LVNLVSIKDFCSSNAAAVHAAAKVVAEEFFCPLLSRDNDPMYLGVDFLGGFLAESRCRAKSRPGTLPRSGAVSDGTHLFRHAHSQTIFRAISVVVRCRCLLQWTSSLKMIFSATCRRGDAPDSV
jgi:hypothetical protein